jgi:hypothetical protein
VLTVPKRLSRLPCESTVHVSLRLARHPQNAIRRLPLIPPPGLRCPVRRKPQASNTDRRGVAEQQHKTGPIDYFSSITCRPPFHAAIRQRGMAFSASRAPVASRCQMMPNDAKVASSASARRRSGGLDRACGRFQESPLCSAERAADVPRGPIE